MLIREALPICKNAIGKKFSILFEDVPMDIRKNKGKQVLVVGHSNTTPQLANAIIGEKKFEQMHDEDNSSLFILTESEGKIIAERISVNH